MLTLNSVALIPNNSITGDTASGQDGSIVATVDTSNLSVYHVKL